MWEVSPVFPRIKAGILLNQKQQERQCALETRRWSMGSAGGGLRRAPADLMCPAVAPNAGRLRRCF